MTELVFKADSFIEAVASDAPFPGGGGASAYAGAIGISLGSMVERIIKDKKKYAEHQTLLEDIHQAYRRIIKELYASIQLDAKYFEPLHRAYSMKAATEEEKQAKKAAISEASVQACVVPMQIAELAVEGMAQHKALLVCNPILLMSDIGAGAIIARAAVESALMNVWINLTSIQDQAKRQELEAKAETLLAKGNQLEQEISQKVYEVLRK